RVESDVRIKSGRSSNGSGDRGPYRLLRQHGKTHPQTRLNLEAGEVVVFDLGSGEQTHPLVRKGNFILQKRGLHRIGSRLRNEEEDPGALRRVPVPAVFGAPLDGIPFSQRQRMLQIDIEAL